MTGSQTDFPFHIRDIVELLRLRVRRRQSDSIYVDCPICGDQRGKMNINYVKNVWRCNYCGEYGGMLALYAKVHGISNSDAYWEICEALQTGSPALGYALPASIPKQSELEAFPQSERAGPQKIHQTYSLLFQMLSLTEAHRKHLRSEKRGLTDEQIVSFGFKSTPPPCLCRSLTERLQKQGCTVQGVPGFYQNDKGEWTVKFHKRTAGILIPAIGIDGMIKGAQILLDIPIRDKDDPPDKKGTKYIWLSSSNKNMGTTSGSPTHFIGDPFARTVYITEGLLKADIAHCLMNRSFIAIAGANNVSQLDPLFALLAQNGTELIVETHDMDKYQNEMIHKGASKIYLMATSHGMDCRRLTWNPNYKGVDDWQLALRKKKEQEKELKKMNFKQLFLYGLCAMDGLEEHIAAWHDNPQQSAGLAGYLGLNEEEYQTYAVNGPDALEAMLLPKRQKQHFRIYQLNFDEKQKPLPFAFQGIGALHKAGYQQPPAAEYRLICDHSLYFPCDEPALQRLEWIYAHYNDNFPPDYSGRSISPSDVLELYDTGKRSYYYCDTTGFTPVAFSPFLCKK